MEHDADMIAKIWSAKNLIYHFYLCGLRDKVSSVLPFLVLFVFTQIAVRRFFQVFVLS